jgi:hypothetical protein
MRTETTGSDGGCASRSSCRSFRNNLLSRPGTGSRSVRICRTGSLLLESFASSARVTLISPIERMCIRERGHSCSRSRFRTKSNGSSNSTGESRSMCSSNPVGKSLAITECWSSPRASRHQRRPSCPSRSTTATSGRAENSAHVRIPQRPNVSTNSTGTRRAARGSFPIRNPSSPWGMTVMPAKPCATQTAASGFPATETWSASPITSDLPVIRAQSLTNTAILQSHPDIRAIEAIISLAGRAPGSPD